MKKTVFTLFILLVCVFQNSKAYEYFTIYFTDGTKSEAFYATDVDSICYSKLSLDSIAYDDWQVQEIYTCDSVYRYVLAQIDSLSFKDVDANIVAEDIDRVNSVIVPLFLHCESIEELLKQLSTIKDIEGVEDAWADKQTLFVKIRNYGTITFFYPPTPSIIDDDLLSLQSRSLFARSNGQITEHTSINARNACVYYQLDKNDARQQAKDFSIKLNNYFNNFGISSQRITNAGPEFFVKDIFNYDLIFLITHGWYDKKTDTHWLYTGEEIGYSTNANNIPTILDYLEKTKIYSPIKMCYAMVPEYRNGQWYAIFYSCVSDKLIASSRNRFKGSETIFFNVACESLKNNDYLGKTFINKGASCYLGYTDSNRTGHAAGFSFFTALLNGSYIGHAYESLYDVFKEEIFTEDGYTYHPVLKILKPDNSVLKKCITKAETLPEEFVININNLIRLNGRIKMLNSRYFTDGYKYGFQLSTNSDMSQAEDIVTVGNYDSSTLYMSWEATLDENTLQPNTPYYYRAYMFDGYSNCYGEIISFTTNGICPDANHPHKIDLGLPSGTLWMCCNYGANAPIDTGDYLAWGETKSKTEYTKDNYVYHHIDKDGTYVYDDVSFDLAPSLEQVEELRSQCKIEPFTMNDIKGDLYIGPNGNKIFVPYSGVKEGSTANFEGEEDHYWTSTLPSDESEARENSLITRSNNGDDEGQAYDWYNLDWRYLGKTVRQAFHK